MTDEVKDLVAAVKTEGGFDVDEPTVIRWLTARQRTMCVRGKAFRTEIRVGEGTGTRKEWELFGITVPGEFVVGVTEILELSVAGELWSPGKHTDIVNGAAGRIRLSGSGGVYVVNGAEAGAFSIQLYPTPAAGDVIVAWVNAIPPVMEANNNGSLIVPLDFHDALVSGAIATGLLRVEGRPDLAQPFEQIFNEACLELRRRTGAKVARPRQIRIAGINA